MLSGWGHVPALDVTALKTYFCYCRNSAEYGLHTRAVGGVVVNASL